jgi:hypothetical protein
LNKTETCLNRTLNKTETCLNRTLNKTETCLNRTLNKTETCLNRTLNKTETCLNRTLNKTETCLNRTLNKTETCLNRTLNKTETCLNRTLNKTETCLNQTLNEVTMKEIFVNLTCINHTPVYSEHKRWFLGRSLYTGLTTSLLYGTQYYKKKTIFYFIHLLQIFHSSDLLFFFSMRLIEKNTEINFKALCQKVWCWFTLSTQNIFTVKLVYKSHSREPENVAFMSSCPLYTG